MPAGRLAWTLCQVPVIYVRSDEPWLRVTLGDGTEVRHPGQRLDASISARVLTRAGGVAAIEVGIPEAVLRRH